MTEPVVMLKALRNTPDDTEALQLVLDLLKDKNETCWQETMEQVPACHKLRERFGEQLSLRGDPRGSGYKALGRLQIHARKGKEDKAWERWELTHSNNHYYWNEPFTLPFHWFTVVDGLSDENSAWLGGWSCKQLYDRVAVAFTKLPIEERSELLQGYRVVYSFFVNAEKLPDLLNELQGTKSPFSRAVVRRKKKNNPVNLLIAEVPSAAFEKWCMEKRIEFTKGPLSSLGSVKSVNLSEDWEGRRLKVKAL